MPPKSKGLKETEQELCALLTSLVTFITVQFLSRGGSVEPTGIYWRPRGDEGAEWFAEITTKISS